MANWRILSIIAMLCQGISPMLHNKAIQTHGAMMNIVLAQVVFVPISVIWLLGHKSEIQLVSGTSFAVSLLASILSIIYAICMFYAMRLKQIRKAIPSS